MDSTISNLVDLGLKEYEAKIYVALVGIGEANARTIHEVSGVPRPRVYDVLGELASRGFVEVRQGTPLIYRAVQPDVVISHLQKNMNRAAEQSIAALETLSLDTRQKFSPLWYVQGDWSIDRHIKSVLTRTIGSLLILALNRRFPERYTPLIAEVAKERSVSILFREGSADGISLQEGVSYYEIGELCEYFRENILENIFSSPILRDGEVFELECIILADERESILVYTQNGERMAVTITLPFITCVQNKFFTQMLSHASQIHPRST
jgi:sugar-specific transcriptional regulator TrmB